MCAHHRTFSRAHRVQLGLHLTPPCDDGDQPGRPVVWRARRGGAAGDVAGDAGRPATATRGPATSSDARRRQRKEPGGAAAPCPTPRPTCCSTGSRPAELQLRGHRAPCSCPLSMSTGKIIAGDGCAGVVDCNAILLSCCARVPFLPLHGVPGACIAIRSFKNCSCHFYHL